MKITYLQLLKLVEQGKQPESIKYMNIPFTWDGYEYVSKKQNRLSSCVEAWTTKAQTTATFIDLEELGL